MFKKVTKLISKNEYRKKIEKEIKQEIKQDILKVNKIIPNFYKKTYSWLFLSLSMVFILISIISFIFLKYPDINNSSIYFPLITILLGFVMFFLFFYSKNKILKLYRNNIDEKKIMKIAFNALKDIELIDIIENQTMPELKKYHRSSIPSYAEIYKKSNIFKLRYKNNYNIEVQTATFRFRDNNLYFNTNSKSGIATSIGMFLLLSRSAKGGGIGQNNSRQIRFENSGVIKINFKQVHPNHSFSLFNPIIRNNLMNKIKLESSNFNKKLNVHSNNKIKIRMIYTPLTMERTLKLYNDISIKNISIQKINNNGIISFENIKEQLEPNFKFYKNVNKTVDVFFENLFKDVYSVYQLLGFFIIPPLL